MSGLEWGRVGVSLFPLHRTAVSASGRPNVPLSSAKLYIQSASWAASQPGPLLAQENGVFMRAGVVYDGQPLKPNVLCSENRAIESCSNQVCLPLSVLRHVTEAHRHLGAQPWGTKGVSVWTPHLWAANLHPHPHTENHPTGYSWMVQQLLSGSNSASSLSSS